jgi:hypothetical protein
MLFYHGKVVFEFAYTVWRTQGIISLAAIRLFPFLQLEPRGQEHENQDRHLSNTGCCFLCYFARYTGIYGGREVQDFLLTL